jgi:small-conductance mechanosensitive channel
MSISTANLTGTLDLTGGTAAFSSLANLLDPRVLIEIMLILLGAYVLVSILTFLYKNIAEQLGHRRIAVTVLIPLTKIIIYISAILIIFTLFVSPTITELVAFFGLFGAALGIGLKDLFADIVGGIVITFEKPFQIGDKLTAGGYYGEVIDIGLRSTRLVTPDDNTVSVPNYRILADSVASANTGRTAMMVVIDLFIDTENDVEAAMRILKDAVVTSKYIYISKGFPYTVLLDDYPYYLRLRAKAYVNDLRYEFEFKSEVTRRAWVAFAREGIVPPRVPAAPQTAEKD